MRAQYGVVSKTKIVTWFHYLVSKTKNSNRCNVLNKNHDNNLDPLEDRSSTEKARASANYGNLSSQL